MEHSDFLPTSAKRLKDLEVSNARLNTFLKIMHPNTKTHIITDKDDVLGKLLDQRAAIDFLFINDTGIHSAASKIWTYSNDIKQKILLRYERTEKKGIKQEYHKIANGIYNNSTYPEWIYHFWHKDGKLVCYARVKSIELMEVLFNTRHKHTFMNSIFIYASFNELSNCNSFNYVEVDND